MYNRDIKQGFLSYLMQRNSKRTGIAAKRRMKWYGGYRFRRILHVYSPKSVVDAMLNEEFDSYWTQTETYEALKIYLDMNFDGLKDAVVYMLGGGAYKIDTKTFQNDMTTFKSKDDVLTLLVHLGYLAYDAARKEVFIPNLEIEEEFEK